LSKNRLDEFKADFKPPSCNSLQELDISFNSIAFATDSEFFEHFLERIKKAKNLRVLWFQGNPFIAPGFERRMEKVVAQLQVLELLNGEPAANFKRNLKSTEDSNQKKQPPAMAVNVMSKGKSKLDKK
jgi:hypothetical protein